ncbi:MAG TPA: Gldg family protein [Patescibacteria group bacterium]|nr:Gldg family protein [Patescibacteria group bacterium]
MRGFKSILGPLGLALILVGGVIYGILYTSGVTAVLPLIAGLILSALSITLSYREAKTEGLRRSARFGIHAGISILFVTAILIFLQTIITRHGATIDTTANKRYSLASQSTRILESLETDITLTCFFKSTSPAKLAAEDLLKEYARITPSVRYRFIDPDKDPVTAHRYEIGSYGTIVVESGGREEKITGSTEPEITNAILRVTREVKKVIYFVTGHGEKSLEDTEPAGLSELKSAFEAENYAARNLLTMRVEHIPEDCEILVFAGPETDIVSTERGTISEYLEGGGDALFLLDPRIELPLLGGIIGAYGISAGDDIIVDRFGRLLAGNYLTPIVNLYGTHAITNGFRHATYFPEARSITIAESPPEGVTVKALATTAPQAYAETNIKKLLEGQSQYEADSDVAGPLHIAAVSTRRATGGMDGSRTPGTETASRIVVFGDSDFASNGNLNLSGNKDLILNTIQWLAEQEDLIAIRPRDTLTQPVVISERQGRVVFWLPVIGIPALALVIGLSVNILKRRTS